METNKELHGRYEKIATRWNCSEYDGLRRDDLIPEIQAFDRLASYYFSFTR